MIMLLNNCFNVQFVKYGYPLPGNLLLNAHCVWRYSSRSLPVPQVNASEDFSVPRSVTYPPKVFHKSWGSKVIHQGARVLQSSLTVQIFCNINCHYTGLAQIVNS